MMPCTIITEDHERQRDEMAALASIYPENEFSYSEDKQITCTANVFPNFPNKLEVRFTNCYSSAASDPVSPCENILIEHLPPISLHIQLPDTYPSQRPPHFHLSIIWLTPWEISFVCQKLDEIWQENQNSEIIFLWLDFLQNDFFEFLGIRDFLDVSFMHTVHSMPEDCTASLAVLCDPRVNKTLPVNIKQTLVSYNKEQCKLQFDKNFHNCDICFEQSTGLQCIELKNCGHIYCKSCVQEHIQMKLKEYNKDISCPSVDCNREIDANDIKTLCPSWFPQYEELMLRVALDTMDDVIYCPRTFCQYPVIRDSKTDSAPICYKCKYCFCVYCRKAYHGNALCEVASKNFKLLVEEYKNNNRWQQTVMEKKYGKRLIQSIEKYLTLDYLQENAKKCPSCRSYVSKITGCNKMTCGHCQAYFCWLCDQEIKWQNPYDHYFDVNTPCYRRLFQGEEDVEEYNNLYLVDDINEGNIN